MSDGYRATNGLGTGECGLAGSFGRSPILGPPSGRPLVAQPRLVLEGYSICPPGWPKAIPGRTVAAVYVAERLPRSPPPQTACTIRPAGTAGGIARSRTNLGDDPRDACGAAAAVGGTGNADAAGLSIPHRLSRVDPGPARCRPFLSLWPGFLSSRVTAVGGCLPMIFTVARFLLDGPVLPIVTETLPLAESSRAALLSRFRRAVLGRLFPRGVPNDPPLVSPSPIFSGKLDGEHRRDHDHAYYLPTDEDHDGRIDHLTVFAAAGFGPDEVAALDALRAVCGFRAPVSPLRLLLVGLGQPRDFTANVFRRAARLAVGHSLRGPGGIAKRAAREKTRPKMRRPALWRESSAGSCWPRISTGSASIALSRFSRRWPKIDVMPLEGPERPRGLDRYSTSERAPQGWR